MKRSKRNTTIKRNQSISNRKKNSKIRLNKFIANSGICSRREADRFIEAGVVSVNGIGVTEMGYKINADDIVKFNNKKITSEKLRYVVLNKPKKYSGRIDYSLKRNSVMDLISSACKEKIYPVDKLNKLESGLLIFTNDTALIKKIKDKNRKIKSIYHIKLNKNLAQEDLENILNGIHINNKRYSLDTISYVKNKAKNEIGVENSKEGIIYIKKIFENLNYSIKSIDRVFFGGLTKKNLPRKHYRHLSEKEINVLKRL